jgi:hypothetical protein
MSVVVSASFTRDSLCLLLSSATSASSAVKELSKEDVSCPLFAIQNENKKTFSAFLKRQGHIFPEFCRNRPFLFATPGTMETHYQAAKRLEFGPWDFPSKADAPGDCAVCKLQVVSCKFSFGLRP